MKNGSLRSEFILLTILVIMVPLIVTNTTAIKSNKQVLQNSMNTLYSNNILSVGMSVENYVHNVNELSTYIIGNNIIRDFLNETSNSPTSIGKTAKAASILSSFPISSLLINKATVISTEGISINSNSYQALEMTGDQKEKSLALLGHGFWDLETSIYGDDCLVFCRSVRNIRNLYQNIGYIKISLNMDTFRSILTPHQTLQNITYHIVDSNNTLIYTSDHALFSQLVNDRPYDFAANTLNNVMFLDNYFIAGYPIAGTDWVIFSAAPDSASSDFNGTFVGTMFFATILCIVVCFLIAICFANIVTKPLVKLGKLMNSVSDGDFSNKLELNNYDELSVLSDQFNQMNDRLNFLYNEVFQNEIRIKEAEFSALVAQMNPHFLYNTLDTIYWIAKSGDTTNVSNMVSKLSKLLRLTLSSNNSNFVTLEQELEHLDCYLSIQKIRFQDQIDFRLTIDDSLRNCNVLKIILQPLIENAITHGINPVGTGSVDVAIYSKDNSIVYKVCNTGKLLNIEDLNQILESPIVEKKGFALKNIAERIRLTYGHKYNITYGFEDGQTCFVVTQPITVCNNNEAL